MIFTGEEVLGLMSAACLIGIIVKSFVVACDLEYLSITGVQWRTFNGKQYKIIRMNQTKGEE